MSTKHPFVLLCVYRTESLLFSTNCNNNKYPYNDLGKKEYERFGIAGNTEKHDSGKYTKCQTLLLVTVSCL